ncbi:hypothetical protein [Arsenicibacter rosenii]|uniref:Uncharacterized protein n=1 Tax=Arsenicibacter rosenii TaxID=1750698 RepID=A0A1S2VPR8_9BACT|nr:hypothetical protein [Arsenicibacter rosenii]OIN60380.1 hypothetical protein BLX24_06025 [Arsenicibacter rosenii]
MKSTVALLLGILMLAGSLFPQTDVEEVYKLPGLVSHYQFHKRISGPEFDFWQFLDLHYNPDSPHAKTPHKGVGIPFYNHLSTGFVFILSVPQRMVRTLATVTTLPDRPFYYQNLYQFQQATPLLQPPRIG